MKEEIVVKDLFRFSYGTIKLKENLKEMNKMAQVIKKKNRSVLLSNRGGYQSPNIEVDKVPGFKDFAIKVLRLAGKYSSIFTFNTFNSSARTLDPINNQLIFFPGWLAHEVTANFSKQKRISMAFNFG